MRAESCLLPTVCWRVYCTERWWHSWDCSVDPLSSQCEQLIQSESLFVCIPRFALKKIKEKNEQMSSGDIIYLKK